MENLNLTQRLDAVLNFINTDKDTLGVIEFYQSTTQNQKELVEILEKLHKDGYIKRAPTSNINTQLNTPTVEGRFFIGYEKQRVLQDMQLAKISRMETDQRIYKDRLLWATLIAGIAAVLLLLWQVWIWFYPVHANYPYWIWETIAKSNQKI